MSAVVTTTAAEIIVEQRVVLHDISWETYERLMREHENRSAPRFAFDNGELEIYMPSQPHEFNAQFLGDFVKIIAEEREIEVLCLGSTTFKKKPKQKGVEPDGCFYLQSYDKVFGVEKINLIKFPPDIAIEIDITTPSINRFPIYADFRVPEIWRYSQAKVEIYVLRGSNYVEIPESAALPKVTGELLTEFLSLSQTERRLAWLKIVREWACANPV